MHKNYFLPVCVWLFALFLTSCASSNVYEKSIISTRVDGKLAVERVQLKKDGKKVSETKKEMRSAEIDGLHAEAIIESSSKEQYDKTTIELFKNGVSIGTKEFKSKNGRLVYDSSSSQSTSQEKNKKYQEMIDYGDFVYVEGNQNIKSFFACKREVTQSQYNAIMGENPSKNKGDLFPVEQISLFDALDFCNKMSIKENKIPCYRMLGNTWYFDKNADGYRLLTGEEFRFAAKGGKNASNFVYSGSSTASEVSWTKSNSGKHTHEVAKKKPNTLGIFDMSGNVWEWVWDEHYTVCGGSALEPPSSSNVNSTSSIKQGDVYEDVGFRIARNVTDREKVAFEEKKKLEDKLPLYFTKAFREVNKKNNQPSQAQSSENVDDAGSFGKIEVERYTEKVTVNSTPNTGYIVYSFLGKPFVIVGSTAWNLLKCTGYAFVNFVGGYSTVSNGNFLWMMPDTEGAKKKAAEARANNGIAYYPEYHKPFTDNTIAVYSYKQKGENEFLVLSGDMKVYDEQERNYDNSISVSRSASADAQSTAAVIGVVGTCVTVPVSAVMWGGGFLAGVCTTALGN